MDFLVQISKQKMLAAAPTGYAYQHAIRILEMTDERGVVCGHKAFRFFDPCVHR